MKDDFQCSVFPPIQQSPDKEEFACFHCSRNSFVSNNFVKFFKCKIHDHLFLADFYATKQINMTIRCLIFDVRK